jgi:hypothetical protein
MSYIVTAYDDDTIWFENAWANLYTLTGGDPELTVVWEGTYNSTILFINGDEWEITFPSEQDYIWFVLRWS